MVLCSTLPQIGKIIRNFTISRINHMCQFLEIFKVFYESGRILAIIYGRENEARLVHNDKISHRLVFKNS